MPLTHVYTQVHIQEFRPVRLYNAETKNVACRTEEKKTESTLFFFFLVLYYEEQIEFSCA